MKERSLRVTLLLRHNTAQHDALLSLLSSGLVTGWTKPHSYSDANFFTLKKNHLCVIEAYIMPLFECHMGHTVVERKETE